MSHPHPAAGRRLAQPSAAHLDDHGEADPVVRQALAVADGQSGYLRAVASLCTARLLMPVMAAGDDSMDGPDPDRHAEMAAVLMTSASGERALLAFTGIDSMTAWRRDARPVLGTLDELAATVEEAGATHLLVDVAGPAQFVVGPELVHELAMGHRLVELPDGGFGWMVASDSPSQGDRG